MNHELLKLNRFKSRYDRFYKDWVDADIDLQNYVNLLQDFRERLMPTGTFSGDRNIEQFYFRARPDNVSDGKDISPSEFGCAPAHIVQKGRCNLKGKPVFYGSESENVAVNEVMIPDGECYYMSMWRSRNNFPKYANFMFDENSTNDRIKEIYEHRKEVILKMDFNSVMGKNEALWLINRITDLFLDKSHSFSSAFAHDAIYGRGLDGIEYPDVKTKNCFNFALSPSFAKKLELVGVTYNRRISESEYIGIKFGTVVDGTIVWGQYESTHNWFKIADAEDRAFLLTKK